MNTDKDIAVTTPAELAEAVRSAPRVLAVGARTKPRLSAVASDVVKISTAKLSGIVEYEPSEFTFTALAGTPVKEIAAALAERGQYLPFDPLLVDAGATIGGTVAAGLGGPGRFRFGGLRDFIVGVRFVDGGGRLLRMGGKVVKNAAGFDLPKFFVGSVGRFGALADVTFKVFPRAMTTRTLRLGVADAAAMTTLFSEAAGKRWELDALEAAPAESAVYARLAGPAAALDALAAEIFSRWPGVALTDEAAAKVWRDVREFGWTHDDGEWVKVALVAGDLSGFLTWTRSMTGARVWVGLGGNVGFVSLPRGGKLAGGLAWPAMTLRGGGALWSGKRAGAEVFRAVKVALDPQGRFPGIED